MGDVDQEGDTPSDPSDEIAAARARRDQAAVVKEPKIETTVDGGRVTLTLDLEPESDDL